MLLFIRNHLPFPGGIFQFKYISCYCLSWLEEQGIPLDNHSNTSHVIVYPRRAYQPGRSGYIQIHLMLLFIGFLALVHPKKLDSNTSHVIVYRTQAAFLFRRQHSNTSHVIVYQ